MKRNLSCQKIIESVSGMSAQREDPHSISKTQKYEGELIFQAEIVTCTTVADIVVSVSPGRFDTDGISSGANHA